MKLEAAFAVSGFGMMMIGMSLEFSLPVALIVGGALLLLAATKRVRT